MKRYQHTWMPPGPRRAILCINHGLFEHGGRYALLARSINLQGIGVVAFDMQGHGRSPGIRGYVHQWEDLISDQDVALKKVREEFPDLPLFVMGHSMGGLLTVSYMLEKRPELAGAIICSGALKVQSDFAPLLQKIAPLLGRMIPRLRTVRLDPTQTSHDPAAVQAYATDPLICHKGIPARTGAEVLKATKALPKVWSNFSWPVLVLHGTGDTITDPEGSRQFYETAASTDKSLRLFDGWYHELMHESGKDEVFKEIGEWISDRC